MGNIIKVIEKLSRKYAESPDDFIRLGSVSALKEKKKKYQLERFEILTHYNVATVEELKEMIKSGSVPEHPAWEDLIEIKNIEAEILEIDNDIRSLLAA